MKRNIFLLPFFLALAVAVLPVHADVDEGAIDRYFNSNGTKIHYTVQGEGEPVILVHGFTADIERQWGLPGIIRNLTPDYQVIALDNRGHGKSDKPHGKEHYGVEMVKDVVRLMDHMEIEKAHVVGYSMGGFMTMYLLTHYPDRLLSATPAGAGWLVSGDPNASMMTELAESLESGKGFGPLVRALTPAGEPEPTKEMIAGFNALLSATNDVIALAAVIRGMSELEVTAEQLKANKVPTLALIGEVDPLKTAVDAMEAVMSNLEVIVIEGANHMTAFTKPTFVEGLKAHLAKHGEQVPATAAN